MTQTTNPFEQLWPELSEIYLQSGIVSLIDHIGAKSEPMQRRGLFLMASQRISAGQDLPRTLADLIAISRAAIDEFAAQAEVESDAEERDRRLDGANILSYNLAADLAPCWPEDPEPRTDDHFKAGIRCAEDCLRWRSELNKGAVPFHMAWWALGTHRCGLADWSGAIAAFESSLGSCSRPCQRICFTDRGRSGRLVPHQHCDRLARVCAVARWRQELL